VGESTAVFYSTSKTFHNFGTGKLQHTRALSQKLLLRAPGVAGETTLAEQFAAVAAPS